MALLTRGGAAAPGSPKALQRFFAFLWPSMASAQQRQRTMQLDAMDCFATELVNRKTKKWEELRDNLARKKDVEVSVTNGTKQSFTQSVGIIAKEVINDLQTLRSPPLGLDTRLLSQPQLDNLLLSTVEIKNKLDFLYLIRQCIRWKQLPSDEVLTACLKYLSTLSRLQQIESLADICRLQQHPLSKTFADMAPFKAMAMWRCGNADVALKTLQYGYANTSASDEGRRMMRNAFRTIAEETLAQKSSAVLVTLMEVARTIHTEQQDVFVIACVWKQCFLSDWFCDQKTAADLFECYKDLQHLVDRRSSSLCSSFLSRHNVDAVHRLIEVFLQYKQQGACANCLCLLFNYQYNRKDLRACAEIVKSCSELEMPLSEIQNEQFLSLFLNQSEMPTSATHRAPNQPEPFQYKF